MAAPGFRRYLPAVTFHPTEATRDAIEKVVADRAGLRLVVLFGSLARGQALPTSDADIGILGGEFWDQLAAGAAIGSLLGREAHVVDLAAGSDVLRYEIARDGVPLHQADAVVWPRFRAEAIVRYLDFQPVLAICAEGARARLRREARRGG
jgi:predicted nucleotidyltransferase